MAKARASAAILALSLAACGSFEAASTPDAGAAGDGGGGGGDGGPSAARYERALSIANTGSTPLPVGHVICPFVRGAGSASLVATNKARNDLHDVRLFGPNGEIERVADVRGDTVVVCARLVRSIDAGQSDKGYAIRYGDPNAGAPAVDPAHVFDLYDPFDVLQSKWELHDAPHVAEGKLVLPKGAESAIHTATPDFVIQDVSLELSIRVDNPNSGGRAAGGDFRYWWGFQTNFDAQQPWSLFISRTGLPNLVWAEHSLIDCKTEAGCASDTKLTQDDAFHTYRIDRARSAGGSAKFWRDDTLMHEATGSTTAIGIIARNYLADSDIFIDWIRARPLAVPEPTITVGDEVEIAR